MVGKKVNSICGVELTMISADAWRAEMEDHGNDIERAIAKFTVSRIEDNNGKFEGYVANLHNVPYIKICARDNYIEETGIMGSYNLQSHDVEYALASQMAGITAGINRELAEQVLERALYYCPVDTGYLKSTGHIEENENGSCSVVFDCPYAWYVHEFTWREHDFPTRSHFLIQAVYEIEKEQGWWA